MRGIKKSQVPLKWPSWAAVRATLLGKIEEAIISGYFTQNMNYELISGRAGTPVYWCDTFKKEPAKLTKNDINTIIQVIRTKLNRACNNIDARRCQMVLVRMRKALESLKKRGSKYFNPDLVLRKAGKIAIVEIQLWPVWLKQQHGGSELTWDVIAREGVALFPRILAKSVRIGGRQENISEFLYVSYSRSPSDHDEIRSVFDAICPAKFNILYFVEILEKVCRENWFSNFFLRKLERELGKLLRELRRGKLSW